MSYIGASIENRVSAQFLKEDFTGDGSATTFTLTNEVPGGSSQNVMVVVNDVIQEPDVAYTITDDASNSPKIISFTGTPASGDSIYVIHRGLTSIFHKPATGSVGANELDTTLKTFTTDTFTGDGSDTTFTLTEVPANSTQIMVFVDGILQKSSTNYSVNTTTGVLTFTSAPDNSAEIEVKHLGIRTTARRALSMFLDNFTGNGSATAFTLSNSASVNDVFVFYNGVAMKPTTDYGISGATLTFTFAPVNNSQIMARYFV
jgi:hypothetical protein